MKPRAKSGTTENSYQSVLAKAGKGSGKERPGTAGNLTKNWKKKDSTFQPKKGGGAVNKPRGARHTFVKGKVEEPIPEAKKTTRGHVSYGRLVHELSRRAGGKYQEKSVETQNWDRPKTEDAAEMGKNAGTLWPSGEKGK